MTATDEEAMRTVANAAVEIVQDCRKMLGLQTGELLTEAVESLRTRLEQAQELAELKQGIIEAADVRIRELADRLEQAERDTARLDWLESNPHGCAVRHLREWSVAAPDLYANNHSGPTLREALDSALAASHPTPQQGDKSV